MPSLDFLEGQSPWLILGVMLIIVAGYVLKGSIKRSGDKGNAREGLASAEAAADYLTKKAIEEQQGREAAEAEAVRLRNALAKCNDTLTELGGAQGRSLGPKSRNARPALPREEETT